MKITVKRVHAPRDEESFEQAAPAGQETPEPNPVEVPNNATIAQLLEKVGVRRADVNLVLVNGDQCDLDTRLHDGDAVAIVGRVAEM